MSEADDRFAIIATLDRYAECLDERDWPGLADVFTEDVEIDWVEWNQTGLDEVTKSIRSYLDGCGPSQHLLGKAIDVRLEGVQTAQLRDAAIRLQRGGVGYYEASDFVHMDTGRVRRW